MKNLYITKKLVFVAILVTCAISTMFILFETSRRFLAQNQTVNNLVAQVLTGDTSYLLYEMIRIVMIAIVVLLVGTIIFSLFFIVNHLQIMYIVSQHDIQIMSFLAMTPKEIVRQVFYQKIKGILVVFFMINLTFLAVYSLLYYLFLPIMFQQMMPRSYALLLVLLSSHLLLAISLMIVVVIIKSRIRKRYFSLS